MARPAKYPFQQMKHGQSFLIPIEEFDGDMRKAQRRVLGSARQGGYQITTRAEKKGLRVWLISETPDPSNNGREDV